MCLMNPIYQREENKNDEAKSKIWKENFYEGHGLLKKIQNLRWNTMHKNKSVCQKQRSNLFFFMFDI